MSNHLQMESENNLQLGRQLLAQGPGVVKALNKARKTFLKVFVIIFLQFFGKNYSSLGIYVLHFSRRNKAHTNLRRFFCKFLGLVTIKNESHINIKESTFSSPTLVPSSPPCRPCGPTVASAPPSTGGRSSRWRTRCSTSSDN